jgi:hypothetical protein
MKQFVLNEQLRNSVLEYLLTRPIREALPLFQLLQSLPEVLNSPESLQPVSEHEAVGKPH